MDTSRIDGVKAPQHRGTPSPHFSFFMAFLRAFFLRLRASSSLMDETLDELEREGMVACFAWGRRCAAGSFWAYAACAARSALAAARARGAVLGLALHKAVSQRRRLRVVVHESAAVEESLSVQ